MCTCVYVCVCVCVCVCVLGVRVGAAQDGKTPLESAKEEGHEEVVRLLSASAGGGGGSNKVHTHTRTRARALCVRRLAPHACNRQTDGRSA